jgi:hypothetical protein
MGAARFVPETPQGPESLLRLYRRLLVTDSIVNRLEVTEAHCAGWQPFDAVRSEAGAPAVEAPTAQHGAFRRAAYGARDCFWPLSQDCASLVLGYFPVAPPGLLLAWPVPSRPNPHRVSVAQDERGRLRVMASHPSGKNKDAARVGHPAPYSLNEKQPQVPFDSAQGRHSTRCARSG